MRPMRSSGSDKLRLSFSIFQMLATPSNSIVIVFKKCLLAELGKFTGANFRYYCRGMEQSQATQLTPKFRLLLGWTR